MYENIAPTMTVRNDDDELVPMSTFWSIFFIDSALLISKLFLHPAKWLDEIRLYSKQIWFLHLRCFVLLLQENCPMEGNSTNFCYISFLHNVYSMLVCLHCFPWLKKDTSLYNMIHW